LAATPSCCGGSDMILDIIYAVAALGLGIYMVAALVRPDKF
jgi:K+-transporting ATPase KdpF subunit